MSYPQVRLVNSPSSTATVLFDFNDDTASAKRAVLSDGFSLGAPDLVGDVDAVDPLYGPRAVAFTLRITGTKANALAAQSALARRLLAGPGWLQVRLHATSDLLFFRTYRAQPGDLSFERVMSTATNSVDDWDLDVELPCEPFAYGEKVAQAAQTITNNPTSGTNQMRITLPAIVGDAPAPLRVEAVTSASLFHPKVMLHMHTGPTARTPANVPIGSSDGLTNGVDTAAGTADPAAVTGSARIVNFATTTTNAVRLSGNTPTLPHGRYKVLVRVSSVNNHVGTITLTMYVAGTPVAVQGSGGYTWVDLGNVDLPRTRPTALDDQGPNIAHPFSLSASRSSATGTLTLDHLLFLPLETYDTTASQVMLTELGVASLGPTQTAVWDGDQDAFFVKTTSTGALLDAGINTHGSRGVFPAAVPGETNILSLFHDVDGAGYDDIITRTAAVVVSYHPRWLWIGDS